MAYRSSTFEDNNFGATSITITAPTGITNDDILVMILGLQDNGALKTITWPSGFTEKASHDGNGTNSQQLYVAWKKASGESGDYTASYTGAADAAGGVMCFSGRVTTGDPFSTAPVFDDADSDPSGNDIELSLTATAGDDLGAVACRNSGGNDWTCAAMTEVWDGSEQGAYYENAVGAGAAARTIVGGANYGDNRGVLFALAVAGAAAGVAKRSTIINQAVNRAANW